MIQASPVRHFPAFIIALGYCVFSMSVVGNFQNTNGDYAQYILHAHNILSGRSWGSLLSGYAAVLPGYPLLLLPVLAVFNVSFYAIALLNVFMLAAIGLVGYRVSLKLCNSTLISLFALLFILANPYLISFQQDAQPNIFFSFSVALVILLFELVDFNSDKQGKFIKFIFVLSLLLPGIIRLEAIALYAALLFAGRGISIYWRLCFLVLIPYPLIVSKILKYFANLGDYGLSAAVSVFPKSLAELEAVVLKALELLSEMPQKLSGLWFGADISLALAIFMSFGVWGLFLLLKEKRHIALYIVFHIGILVPFLLFDPVLPTRYLTPIAWIWVLAVAVAFSSFLKSTSINFAARLLFTSVFLLLSYVALKPEIQKNAELPEKRNYFRRSDLGAAFDYAAKHYPEAAVAFYKPRIATLLLAERGIARQGVGARSARQAIKHFNKNGVVIVMLGSAYGNAKMFEALNKLCKPVFSSGIHVVFKKTPVCFKSK